LPRTARGLVKIGVAEPETRPGQTVYK